MSTSRYLPHVLQTFLNTPVALHDNASQMLVAALSGRLNISSLAGAFGHMERERLEELAASGRSAADAKKARKKAKVGSVASMAKSDGDSFLRVQDDVAYIEISGTLTRRWGVGSYSGTTGYDGILTQLSDAVNDDSIKAIWFDIDSPGGTVNGLFDLADTIYSVRDAKPIHAMAADYAYSAAYLLGSSAGWFGVNESGGVGSVGVMTHHASFKEAHEKEGIKVTVLREPELKATGTRFEDLDEETEAHIREQLRALTSMFQARVARNMNIDISAVAATKGRDYMGITAKAVGFVSEVLPEPIAWEKLRAQIGA